MGERTLSRIDRELKEMGPQADEVWEQQLSSIGQQLKEKCVCPRRTRMDTDGGPQADDVGKRLSIKNGTGDRSVSRPFDK